MAISYRPRGCWYRQNHSVSQTERLRGPRLVSQTVSHLIIVLEKARLPKKRLRKKLEIRVRVCLQAYRKCRVINRAFRRCEAKTEFLASSKAVPPRADKRADKHEAVARESAMRWPDGLWILPRVHYEMIGNCCGPQWEEPLVCRPITPFFSMKTLLETRVL